MAATLSAPPTFRRAMNDNISGFLCDMVPGHLGQTDRFLDIVTWNLRYFNSRDPERVEVFTRVLQEINADVFVFQEVEGGALDEVAHNLVRSGAGLYAAEYGTTGGRNRVALLFDTEWVRNTTELRELYAGPSIILPGSRREVFPRLPLAGEFIVRSDAGSFNLDLVGLHLKSSRASSHGGGGEERRKIAARHLATWLEDETSGEDVIITGDWNSTPDGPEWQPFDDLRNHSTFYVGSWNPKGEISHVIQRRSPQVDAIVLAPDHTGGATVSEVEGHRCTVLGWTDAILGKSVVPKLQEKISNDLPVLARFVFPR